MKMWKEDPVHFVSGSGIANKVMGGEGGNTLCGKAIVDGHRYVWTATVMVFDADPAKCKECAAHPDWPLIRLGDL